MITMVNSTTAASTGTSSLLTSIPWTPTAGNVLVLHVGGSVGTSGVRSLSVTGWVKVAETFLMNTATLGGIGTTFIKISSGNEGSSPPTITVTGGTTILCYIIEEWPGASGGAGQTIDTNYFPDQPTPVGTYNSYTNTGTTTMNSTTVTMPIGDCLVLSVIGGRGTTTQAAPTWGGGATASTTGATGQQAFCFSGMQEVTSTGSSVTHTATISDVQTGPVEVVGSVVFRIGSSKTSPVSWLRV